MGNAKTPAQLRPSSHNPRHSIRSPLIRELSRNLRQAVLSAHFISLSNSSTALRLLSFRVAKPRRSPAALRHVSKHAGCSYASLHRTQGRCHHARTRPAHPSGASKTGASKTNKSQDLIILDHTEAGCRRNNKKARGISIMLPIPARRLRMRNCSPHIRAFSPARQTHPGHAPNTPRRRRHSSPPQRPTLRQSPRG